MIMLGSPAGAVRIAAVALAAFIVGILAVPGVAMAQPGAPTQLNATDMALLNGVRLAGLWEIPAGQMAAEKGSREVVRKIGAEISSQHVKLDQLVVEAANKLGAVLPSEPNADQKGWLAEMQNSSGGRFDRVFVDRLRAAHGKIFPVIGAVRAGTRNAVIRKLAEDANDFVMHHMSMLESTGLVRYEELPPAALPVAQDNSLLARARANAGLGPAGSPTLIWVVLLVAASAAVFATVRILRSR
jgi:predicted outer membrane protein